MPFLTRDFAVFLGLVAFLLTGIISTASYYRGGSDNQAASLASALVDAPVEYTADTPDVPTNTRESKLADLKDKVASIIKSAPAKLVEEVVEEPTPEDQPEAPSVAAVLTCPSYHEVNPAWSATGLKFDVVEGARLVYREGEIKPVTLNASGTPLTLDVPNRDVVLQLPLRSFASGVKSCIATDVVGIATDGSLIRNNEQGLYRVFGEDTLIGYSMDGFTIYGLSDRATDECGGVVVDGEYRYYLSQERETVLGCFGATPVGL